MTEATGLAVGVVALAGLFNNAVQCFEYIQLGRGFGKAFQTCQLKLDNARLRLSRWGTSVGLSEDFSDAHLLEGSPNIQPIQARLEQVIDLFVDAEGISHKFKRGKKVDDIRLATYDARTDMDNATAQLHNRLRELSLKRQNRTPLRQKTYWALYEEKNFRRLIEDLTDLIDSLVELYPASQETQRQLCEAEASALSTNEALPALREITAEQDKLLEEAFAKISGENNISHNIVFSGSNNSGFQIGHNSGAISGINFGRGD